jgi:glycerophosphoryl diester phosphodiesterase
MPAFATALALGADGLESDAWVTADGVAVLDHDGLIGPRWRRVPIAKLRRDELPAHIPALGELYTGCGTDFELSLDLKADAAVGPVLAAAAAAGAEARLWLCHHQVLTLEQWRSAAGPAHLVWSTARRFLTPSGTPPVAELVGRGIAAVNLRAREWDAGLVAALHDGGLAAFGWDVQTAAELRRAADLGLDGVYSDHVDTMVEVLAAARRQM